MAVGMIVPVLFLSGFASSRAEPPAGQAQAAPATGVEAGVFAPPVLMRSGDKPMGARRLYPSPVLQDMNGDGRADVVLGDLWGRITVATRAEGDGPPRFGPDEPLLGRDGAQLDFKNW